MIVVVLVLLLARVIAYFHCFDVSPSVYSDNFKTNHHPLAGITIILHYSPSLPPTLVLFVGKQISALSSSSPRLQSNATKQSLQKHTYILLL